MSNPRTHAAFLEMEQSLGLLVAALTPSEPLPRENLGKLWSRALSAYDAPSFVHYRMVAGKLGLLAGTDRKISASESAAIFGTLQTFMYGVNGVRIAVGVIELDTVMKGRPVSDALYLSAAIAKTSLDAMALQMEAVDAAYRQTG